MHTHFIAVYSVLCVHYRRGERVYRKDYCVTEPREMKYLETFSKCNPSENVAVFKIKLKPGVEVHKAA